MSPSTIIRSVTAIGAIALLAVALSGPALAASATWLGTTDTAWSITTNWSGPPAAVPGVGDTATFNAAAGVGGATITTGNISLATLLFDTATVAAYTIGGATAGTGQITFGDGTTNIVTMNATVAQNQLINANLILGTAIVSTSTVTNNSTTNTLTIAGNITGGTGGTAADKVLTVTGSGNTTLSGIIGKGGANNLRITKTGSGTLTLGNANTFTHTGTAVGIGGGTVVLADTAAAGPATNRIDLNNAGSTAGTLQAASANAFGASSAGTTIQSGAALQGGNITMTNPEPLSLAGTGLASAPVGALTATANTFTWIGPITIASGGATIGGGAGALTLSSTATVDNAGNTLTLSHGNGPVILGGVISGTGNVIVAQTGAGTGDVPLNAANTYTGGTSLNAGSATVVGISSTGTAGSPTNGPFGAGATPLVLNGGQLRSGTGGPFSIGNTVTLAANTTFFTVSSERSLIFTGPVTITGASRTLTSDVGTTVAGTGVFFNGAIGDGGNNLGLTKAGTGNLTLSGANTYTGVTGGTGGNLFVTGSLGNNSGLSIVPAAASGAVVSFVNNAANTPANFSSLSLGSATGTSFIGLDLGTSSDSIVTSAAATATNNITFNINASTGFGAGNYTLISAASGLTAGGASYGLGTVPGGYTYGFSNTDSLVQLTATAATAGSRYWRGNLGTSWATLSGANTNWATDAAGALVSASTPGAGDTVFFSATGPAITTTLDNAFTINDLQFLSAPTGVSSVTINPGVNPMTLSPGTLTIAPSSSSNGIALAQGAGAVTIAAPVVLGAAQTWSVDSSTPGAGTASSLTVSGAISGGSSNGLTFTTTAGTTPIILSSTANTYSGSSTISANTIVQGGATNAFSPNTAWTVNGTLNTGAFNQATGSLSGSGTVQNSSAANAVLTIGSDNVSSATFAGTIQNGSTGTLGITKTGTGTQTLSGASTFTGPVTVNGGLIAFATSPATSGPLGNSTVVNLNGAGISYTASGANALNRSAAIGAGNGTVDVASAAGTLTVVGANVTSTGGNLIKTGAGTLSISGSTTLNAGAAGVVVSGGTLQAGFGTGGIGAITVGSSGNLSFQNSTIEALILGTTGTVLTLNNGARLGFELNGATNDSITVPTGGGVSLGGAYTFDFFNSGAGVGANTNTVEIGANHSLLLSYGW